MKIPSFQGRTDPEVYLEWEKKIDLVFDCHNYSEEKKVKLAVIEFTDYVIIWWDQLVTNRRRNNERPVETWGELKAIMRRRFVPSHFYRDLYQKLQNLTQGSRSVEDYHKEMEVAMIRANVEEDREATMARFLSGLNRDIANIIELQHYVKVEDMVHMAMKVERQLKRKGTARYTSVSNTTWKSKWDKNDPAEAKRKTEPPMGKDEGTSNKPKVESQPSRNRDIKCFKCLGSGHIASQWPNRRVMIMSDNGEVMTESEDDSDGMPELVDASDDDEVVYPVTGESLVARRALNTHFKMDDAEQQRENIFHTRCHVNNKWLQDCGEIMANKQVLISFSIGKYKDEVLCDVAPMHAGHILLGRPWQFDRKVTHDGFKNSVVVSLLQEYEDVFPNDVPSGLPPIRGIEHQIDFVPGATIPNRPAYRSNPEETKELQRQVEELLAKGHVRERMSPCAVSVILVPKKDGTWRMCVDCRVINNITVKIRGRILLRRGGMMGTKVGLALKILYKFHMGQLQDQEPKKIKEAMQGLVQSTWDEASKSPTIKHITMSHKSDSSPKGKADNSSFVLQAMQQQFERLNFVLGEVRDRMDHQEAAIRNLQGGRDRRRRERRVENEYENEGDGEDEEDLASEVGSGRHRRVRRERGHEWNPGVFKLIMGSRNSIPRVHITYLEWEKKIDLVFDCHNYSEEKKVKLAVIEFTDYAIIWWDQLVTNRRRNTERPVETWGELKALMRRRFVPSHFYRDFYQRLQNLTQGSRSVEDYHKEMEVAMIRANVEEDREATMARFLSGLNRDIANVIELQHYVEIEDMVHMAMKVERQLKRKGTARYTSVSNTTWKSKGNKNDPAEAKRKTEPPMGKDEGTSNKPQGHIASQCPNRRVMIMRDNGEVMTESEDDSDGMPELVDASDDDEVVYPVTGESLVARRALNTHFKVDDAEQQRENIFHTRCHVNNKEYEDVFPNDVPSGLPPIRGIEHLYLV
uniref:Retrotransposon gag domain-containing protein n=1 Tax=Fagus sylvatica TaxID=28930 RepID=A0A2N9GLY6_FAGSY